MPVEAAPFAAVQLALDAEPLIPCIPIEILRTWPSIEVPVAACMPQMANALVSPSFR